MKRLTDFRLAELNRYLETSGLSDALMPELLDHLACEAEERLWAGKPLEEVIESLRKEVDPDVLLDLSLNHKHLLAMNESLNDIVFENRNKLYGAYALRRDYGGNVQRATIIGVGIFLLMFLLPELYARLKTTDEKDIAFMVEAKTIKITPEKITPIAPPVVEPTPPTAKTVRSRPYEVMPDEQVPIEMPPPTVEMLENAQTGQANVDGESFMEFVVPPAEAAGTGKGDVIEVKPEEEKTLLFAEQQPQFFGGSQAFANFLQKNLKYPRAAAQAGIQGKVFVEFTVSTDGKIEKAKTIKGIGFGCDEEAIRVVNMMPDWLPGKQSGVPVRVRFTLPIAFQLE
ncbi:energy transducer TonB [Persicitalea jodogahamensis]|uniref:Cell envelope biogenesis protein TonB n=1 Tax=Persicitalea jodogahamensis TaxID=402147 RepID=A0A8J3GBX4_9BACT|nr:energy transducer TonB [Persicitalea jodogahamensis]GHB80729.1 cell envelope biogenesis protein TonB [Persicitalea jodogahamensis]